MRRRNTRRSACALESARRPASWRRLSRPLAATRQAPRTANAALAARAQERPLASGVASHQLTSRAGLLPLCPCDLLSAGLLGAIAGGVDAAGWFCLAGLLPSHLTASLVMLSARVADYDAADIRARIAMLPVFICTVALVKWVARGLTARQLPVLPILLAMLSAGLAIFCVAGALSDTLLADDPHLLLGIGGLGVASMAVQNAIMRLALAQLGPTTVMTGNLTQLVMAGVDVLAGLPRNAAPGAERDARTRLVNAASPLLGFLLGSISCGIAATHLGLLCLVLPLALSLASTAIAWRNWRNWRAESAERRDGVRASGGMLFPLALLPRS